MGLARYVGKLLAPKLNVTSYTDIASGGTRVILSSGKGYLSANNGWVANFNDAHDFGSEESARNWAEASGYRVTILRSK